MAFSGDFFQDHPLPDGHSSSAVDEEDVLNDETFGAAEIVDWEAEHEKMTAFDDGFDFPMMPPLDPKLNEESEHAFGAAGPVPSMTHRDVRAVAGLGEQAGSRELGFEKLFFTNDEDVQDVGIDLERNLQQLVIDDEETLADPAIINVSKRPPGRKPANLEQIFGQDRLGSFPSAPDTPLLGSNSDAVWSILSGRHQQARATPPPTSSNGGASSEDNAMQRFMEQLQTGGVDAAGTRTGNGSQQETDDMLRQWAISFLGANALDTATASATETAKPAQPQPPPPTQPQQQQQLQILQKQRQALKQSQEKVREELQQIKHEQQQLGVKQNMIVQQYQQLKQRHGDAIPAVFQKLQNEMQQLQVELQHLVGKEKMGILRVQQQQLQLHQLQQHMNQQHLQQQQQQPTAQQQAAESDRNTKELQQRQNVMMNMATLQMMNQGTPQMPLPPQLQQLLASGQLPPQQLALMATYMQMQRPRYPPPGPRGFGFPQRPPGPGFGGPDPTWMQQQLRNQITRGFMPQMRPQVGGHSYPQSRPGEDHQNQYSGRPEWASSDSEDEDVDPNNGGWMTQSEKDWVVKIQTRPLHVDNPYVQDYYYTILKLRELLAKREADVKSGLSVGAHPLMSMPAPVTVDSLLAGGSGEPMDPSGGNVAMKPFRPVQFENSLGKLTTSSYYYPRTIIDVSGPKDVDEKANPTDSSSISKKDKEVRKNRQFRRRLIDIEQLYTRLLQLDEYEKSIDKILVANTPNRTALEMERRHLLHVLVKDTIGDQRFFVSLFSVHKGCRYFGQLTNYLDQICLEACLKMFISRFLEICRNSNFLDEESPVMFSTMSRNLDKLNRITCSALLTHCWELEDSRGGVAALLANRLGISLVFRIMDRFASQCGKDHVDEFKAQSERLCTALVSLPEQQLATPLDAFDELYVLIQAHVLPETRQKVTPWLNALRTSEGVTSVR